MTRKMAALVMVVGGLVTAAVDVQAQTAPYNRGIDRVEVVEAENGLQRVHVRVLLKASGFVVLNYDLTVLVNGVPQTFPQDETYNWATGGCSSGDACSGCPSGYSCIVGVPGAGCLCGKWASVFTTPQQIDPGDVVEAFITPARGGFPEIETNDDAHFHIHDGTEVYWNREIDFVEVAGGGRGGDVDARDYLIWQRNGSAGTDNEMDLSSVIEIRRLSDNALLRTVDSYENHNNISPCVAEVPDDPSDCTSSCGTADLNDIVPFPLECELYFSSGEHPRCRCAASYSILVPNITIPDGDGALVILKPAPNALPELPGLEGDNEEPVIPGRPCGDFDGDGDTDGSDFGVFAQCFGGSFNPPAATCPPGADADLDDDGDVDAADFALFAQCFTGAQ